MSVSDGQIFVFVLSEESELVNEVLEDIPRHEEEYLDVTLEEEGQLIATLKAYLNPGPVHTI